jgi:predicted RNA-binding protein with PUA domain
LTAFNGIIQTFLFFLPAFYSFKVLLLLWLFYPKTNGAKIIYEKFIKAQHKQVKELLQEYKLV